MSKWQRLVHLPITVRHWLWPPEYLSNSSPPLNSQHWLYFYFPMLDIPYFHPWTHHLFIEISFAPRWYKGREHVTRFSILGFSESELWMSVIFPQRKEDSLLRKSVSHNLQSLGIPCLTLVYRKQTYLLWVSRPRKPPSFLKPNDTEWLSLCLAIWNQGFASNQWPDSAHVGQLITKDKYL